MNMRQTLILATAVLLGCLIVGAFLGRPSAAEPKADATAAGRYQGITVANPNSEITSSIVVLDTATGECWSIVPNSGAPKWKPLSSPAKGQ
jgi:hypothetical protein